MSDALTPAGSVACGASRGEAPLAGQLGQEFVQTMLSTQEPLQAIAEIQRRCGLPDPRCGPLLGLLDQLGLSRHAVHAWALARARAELLRRLDALPPEALLALLEASFPFVGLEELRAVPLAVLDRLQPVPASFLKQLVGDPDLFRELPLGVQRQAWDLDRKLLQAHALAAVVGYTLETATVLRTLDMLPRERAGGAPAPATQTLVPALPRRILRRGSAALQRLTRMTGHSRRIYRGLLELVTVRFRDSEGGYVGAAEAALCALRSQLLMALHDAGEAELCARDGCHKLAWTLDACLSDGRLDARRAQELASFFSRFEERDSPSGRRGGGGRARGQAPGDDAESSGVPGASSAQDPDGDLGDAGLVLRDPPAFYFLAHQAIARVRRAAAERRQPKDDAELLLLTRLLQLAVGCRAGLKHGRLRFAPPADEVVRGLFPVLASVGLEAMLREPTQPFDAETEASFLDTVTPLLVRGEVVRKLIQMFVLESVAQGDLTTAKLGLRAMAAAMESMADASIPEFAPFGFTLARQMTLLVAGGQVSPEDELWALAVDAILIKIVDSEIAVHEEVLRLLLAAAPRIELLPLANYLHHTLSNSRKSRKRYKKRKFGAWEVGGDGWDDGAESARSASGRAEDGEGAADDGRGADGIKATYLLLARRVPGLNATTAPTLFAYLESS